MLDCPDCTTAATKTWGAFTNGCMGCCARAAARSPHFARVRDAGRLDRQYRLMLEQFGLTHDQVRRAAEADFEMRGPK